ncbi:MAG: hypothetical protein LBQ75_00070 [Zoogloeaceae bacterium]|jgi:hypothetical protein|nr:hypothetical protein [Zoogloeaceae bacterium]
MSEIIYDSWHDFQASFAQILARAESELCIFDDTLDRTGLAEAANMETLRVLLTERPQFTVCIALRDTDGLTRNHPRLLRLMQTYHHTLKIQKISDNFVPRRDCMALADGQHGVVRFDWEQPRCKLMLDEENEVQPYWKLFNEIWTSPAIPFSPTIVGL